MSREQSYSAIILKKQPFGDADELITVYTKELGKLRVLAKSVKLAKSKLQHGLQVLFLVKLSVAGAHLPKVIGVEVIKPFSNIRENLQAAKTAFYALELILKFSPDEQKNVPLYQLAEVFFNFINEAKSHELLNAALAKFKIEFLNSIGLSIQVPGLAKARDIFFSCQAGGFCEQNDFRDAQPVHLETLQQFNRLSELTLKNLPEDFGSLDELQNLLSGFLRYHLERDIKSGDFLLS